jgi:hypothetical protein
MTKEEAAHWRPLSFGCLYALCGAGEKLHRLCSTSAQQSGQLYASALVPLLKLGSGLDVVTVIEQGQKRGVLKVTRATVEDEVHERIKLRLSQRNDDNPVYFTHCPSYIFKKPRVSLCVRARHALADATCVPVPNRPDALTVWVCNEADAFKAFRELEAALAIFQSLPPNREAEQSPA